jgi:hypothetical protein
MPPATGFRYDTRKNGDVVIYHHARIATTLRGKRAAAFLADIDGSDHQELMARITGNYKRGNERQSSKLRSDTPSHHDLRRSSRCSPDD